MCSFVIGRQLKDTADEIQTCTILFQVRRDALQQHVSDSVAEHLDLACAKLKRLEVRCNRFSCVSCVWKVPDFEKLQQEAKRGKVETISSEPFYTWPQGYKMKMKIYRNGHGDAKGSHLSIFAYIMKGEYDSILSWPFEQKIKITLIDQQQEEGKRKDCSQSITPDPSWKHFQRPVKEMNIGVGKAEKFVSHEVLQTRRYIVDDTIFLKIEVG